MPLIALAIAYEWRVPPLLRYVAELEQMVLAEANARQREERAASESEERLLARIAVLEAQKASLVNLEGELKRQQAAHDIALHAVREIGQAAIESAQADARAKQERALRAESELERQRSEAEAARLATATARAAQEAAAEAHQKAQADVAAAQQAVAAARAELRVLYTSAAEADDARQIAERNRERADALSAEMRERLEKIGEERQSSRARELASELAVAEAQAKLREAERKYSVLEASMASERGRGSRLRDEVDVLMRSVEEARQQVTAAEEGAAAARERERQSDHRAEEARAELERERHAHSETTGRLERSGSESAALTSRLGAQLERERDGRSAAERRVVEASISMQLELQEAQRKAAVAERANEKLVLAARGAAAAYCSRVLHGRSVEATRRAFGSWIVAVRCADAANRAYEVEERARQNLMMQARTFQTRLELLAMTE